MNNVGNRNQWIWTQSINKKYKGKAVFFLPSFNQIAKPITIIKK